MNTPSNSYCQSMATQTGQNRQVMMLMLLLKLSLVMLIGIVYAGITLWG